MIQESLELNQDLAKFQNSIAKMNGVKLWVAADMQMALHHIVSFKYM